MTKEEVCVISIYMLVIVLAIMGLYVYPDVLSVGM